MVTNFEILEEMLRLLDSISKDQTKSAWKILLDKCNWNC